MQTFGLFTGSVIGDVNTDDSTVGAGATSKDKTGNFF
jgi:hypothetical protein